MSRKGRMSLSLIESQMMRVISSPRMSTTGPVLIFCAILLKSSVLDKERASGDEEVKQTDMV